MQQGSEPELAVLAGSTVFFKPAGGARRADRMTSCEPDPVFGVCQPVRRSSWFCLPSFRGPFLDRLRGSFSHFVVRRCRRYYAPASAADENRSEFLLAFMSDLPPEAFSDRSVLWCACHPLKTETNRISRFSRLECPRMHRFSDSAVSATISPIAIAAMFPTPCQDRIGTRKWCSVHVFWAEAQWLACVTLRTDA